MTTAGTVTGKSYDQVFCGLGEPLDLKRAQVEASRCFYCYDAPCIEACPTGIDIPSFIRKIGNGNVRGAALDILGSNILGGTCARACPVETLCQQACVREASEEKPVEIGLLQRYATDEFFKSGEKPFRQAKSTGKSVAVIGAGPAGLSAAHRLALLGNSVTIFEAKEKAGGLNEYGLAPYKMTDDFAQKEVAFVMSVGGIKIEHGKALGLDLKITDLTSKFDAVFLGVGLGAVNRLGIPGEAAEGVLDAAKFIEKIRQVKDLAKIPVARNVVVIGGGNTAVDIAIQMKKLGAEFVTIAYRRGVEQMGATHHEQELAQTHGVLIKTFVKPVGIVSANGKATGIELEYTALDGAGKLVGTGTKFTLPAEQIFKAIGQTLDSENLVASAPDLKFQGGKVSVNADFSTNLAKVFAGGDCTGVGEDLTVTAVQQGKLAAEAIHVKLGGSLESLPNAVLGRGN